MIKKYLPLSKEKYLHKPNYVSPEELHSIYQLRLNNFSTVKTNLFPLLTKDNGSQTNEYPIFFVYIPDIVNLANTLNQNSNKIKSLANDLPGIAKQQFLNSLIAAEINYTNKIEGIKTDKREISTLIKASDDPNSKISNRRLQSTVRMYTSIIKDKILKIEELKDFRTIYDNLLNGEITKDKLPNGKLFRDIFPDDSTLRIGNATETVHIPPRSESEINKCLQSLIDFMNSDLPPIYKSLVTHFFFENTHPFIDGNGRMGRYLLSTYLAHKYDVYTGYSVSTAIHERVQSYYRIFKEADQAENFAELTFFIKDLLKILIAQQQQIILTLNKDKEKLIEVTAKNQELVSSLDPQVYEHEVIAHILFYLAESKLFASNQQLAINDRDIIRLNSHERKISKRRTQLALEQLEKLNWIKLISARPKQHELII